MYVVHVYYRHVKFCYSYHAPRLLKRITSTHIYTLHYPNTYMKAVGKRCQFGPKISSRTFCAAVQEDHLSSHLAKPRGPYAARVTLDFALESVRGGHTNRHSECSPAQGF